MYCGPLAYLKNYIFMETSLNFLYMFPMAVVLADCSVRY